MLRTGHAIKVENFVAEWSSLTNSRLHVVMWRNIVRNGCQDCFYQIICQHGTSNQKGEVTILSKCRRSRILRGHRNSFNDESRALWPMCQCMHCSREGSCGIAFSSKCRPFSTALPQRRFAAHSQHKWSVPGLLDPSHDDVHKLRFAVHCHYCHMYQKKCSFLSKELFKTVLSMFQKRICEINWKIKAI